jgi:hypothetical protein
MAPLRLILSRMAMQTILARHILHLNVGCALNCNTIVTDTHWTEAAVEAAEVDLFVGGFAEFAHARGVAEGLVGV